MTTVPSGGYITSPNQTWGYHAQSGNGSVDGVDSWNPDEFTPGDQHFGSITGRDVNSHFGRSLDTDFDGTRLVAGGPEWDNDRGYIQIYDWSESSSTWTSLQQIDGPAASGWFGESVSMDYDGTRIIVGAPKIRRVYVYDVGSNGQFTLTQIIKGQYTISGGFILHREGFGHCVSIAGDKADRFVVGAPAHSKGHIYVYERQTNGLFTEVYESGGNSIVNRVPTSTNSYITLYSKFNGYGFSVKMSGFGEHIIVGAPGTEIAEIQCSNDAGTTTPGPVSHHLGEHVTSSRGPHYTGSTSYACSSQILPNIRNISASHPYSVYKYPGTQTNNNGDPANGLRFADSNSQKHHYDRSPYGTNNANMKDGYLYPNFQLGNIRVLKCPTDGSWSSGVTTVQTIEGRNNNTVVNLGSWNNIYSSLPGFGRSVSISVDGKRICAGSPGFKPQGYDLQVMHGDVRYFTFNEDTGQYDEPMNTRDESVPSLGGPWNMLRKNLVSAGFNMSMTEDGSRVFAGSREHQFSLMPYDFSGTTFYPAGPIVMSGGQGSGPDPTVFGTVGPVPDITGGIGCMNGYRSAAHSGTNCAVSIPAYPEAYGADSNGGTLTTPATSNGQGRGIILIYRYTLTSVFRGNSLFEGYVKCDNLTVGSSGGSVDHARIKFGGRKGEVNSESGATIENRWMGTRNVIYTGTLGDGYKHDNELLISKSYNTLHEPNDTVKYGDWNKRDFFGDRVRIKAPKIEFQIHSPETDQLNNKYRESPCVSITDMNNPFGGRRGMKYTNNSILDEPRQLVSIRSGTSNSRLQAGLRLIAGSSSGFVSSSADLTSAIPSDGDTYTFAPGNDGWLRLLCPSGQSQSTAYQTETDPDNSSKTIASNYAGLAVGDLYVAGSLSGPGAPSGGGSSLPLTSSITGTYGSVQTTGSGNSGWKGYSINGDWVFMSNYTECGIFNDIDNEWAVLCRRNNSVRLAFDGGTKLTTTSYGVLVINSLQQSDDRIKYNEESITNCLGIVKQLRPLKYEKLDRPEDAVGTWIPTDDEWESVKNDYNWNDEYGFVAQDVRNIPGLDILVKGDETEEIEIIKTESEYNRLSVEDRAKYTYRADTNDYRHNDSGETQTPLGVNYTGIIPILTGAIQELSGDLEQEKQKTENLQTRLTASEQAYQSLLERVVALENA